MYLDEVTMVGRRCTWPPTQPPWRCLSDWLTPVETCGCTTAPAGRRVTGLPRDRRHDSAPRYWTTSTRQNWQHSTAPLGTSLNSACATGIYLSLTYIYASRLLGVLLPHALQAWVCKSLFSFWSVTFCNQALCNFDYFISRVYVYSSLVCVFGCLF